MNDDFMETSETDENIATLLFYLRLRTTFLLLVTSQSEDKNAYKISLSLDKAVQS